jgi:glucose dehydrogenase
MVDSLVVADDNHLPYFALGHTAVLPQRYELGDVHAFIAPLPDKIFYPADAVETLSASLPTSFSQIPFPQQDDIIIRYFVTTAATLRRHMREHQTEFSTELINMFMQIPMAQFVWVVEYSTHEEWNANRISVRAIIDATAGVHDNDVLWAVYGKGIGLFFDRIEGEAPSELKWNPGEEATFGRMETNLHPVGLV